MPETSPSRPRTTCQCGHNDATRVLEYRIPDPLSATGDEHYGPYHVLICHTADCRAIAEDIADVEGGTHLDLRPLAPGEAHAICEVAA